MTTTLDSLVGELYLVAGARQSTTPATNVATAPRRAARGRADDTLYVLIDLNGNSSSGVLAELLDKMHGAYWAMPGSVTSALRAALNAAAEWLMDRNTNAPVPDRLNGGISCAVLRGQEVFLAQTGPACAYVTQHAHLSQYPLPDGEPITPLGMSRASEVRFARVDLQPGDMLVLTDARLAQRVPIEAVASAIVGVGVQRALANLEQVAGNGDLIALVVEAAGATDAAESTPAADSAPADRPTAPARPSVEAQPVAQPREVPPQEVAPARPAPKVEVQIERPAPKPQPAVDTTPREPREPRRTTAKVWLDALLKSVRRSAGSVGTAGQLVVQRTLPESTAGSRDRSGMRTTAPVKPVNAPLMAGIALGIPIIVSLLVATVYIQGKSKADFEIAMTSANNEISLAGQTTGAEARKHWQKVIEYATEALGMTPDDQTAKTQIAQAQAAIDRLDNVVRVQPVNLWNFKSSGQHRLALQGFSLFVLDRGLNTIDRITLNAAGDGLEGNGPEHILAQSATIDGQTPGALIDMAWQDSSDKRSTSSLIVLHQTGLMEYNLAFGWKKLDFGANTVPVNARRLRSFIGNLYVLDPAANQVLRYSPQGEGYSTKPENYFEQAPAFMPKAVDMAIDGSIYVATNDGQVSKYLGGKPDTFQVTGLPEPLHRLGVIAVDSTVNGSSVYIAEQGANRIVQLRPDGKFVRQFRANGSSFDAIEDLLVDEANNRLFVISGGVLSTVALPPIQ